MLFSKYGKDYLDYLSGRDTTVTTKQAIYAGLSTTEPAIDGTNITEPVGAGYARALVGYAGQSMTLKMITAYDEVGTGIAKTHNNYTIFFPKATGNWGVITHLVLFTAETGGDPVLAEELASPITPVSGDVPLIEPENLSIKLS